ncbi:MAG: spore coat protein CotJB [Clostridia bacterium]|nr:spore coat protein CotJB [Clostridia bacterium]
MNKAQMMRKIFEYDFAIHELVLFLDSHPTNKKALELIKEYRARRKKLVSEYEERFGPYIMNSSDAPANYCWEWLEGPWPWENNFMEG